MSRTLLHLLLAVAVLVAAGYFWDPRLQDAAVPLDSAGEELPRTYLENSRSIAYDEHGVMTEVIEARAARFYAGRNISVLDHPRFYSHDGNDKTWSASADQGTYRHTRDVLILEDNVQLINDQTQGRLETDAMVINLTRQTARSDAAVTLSQGPNRTRADGMVANLKSERINLTGNVESLYVIPE
jgi:LPS export ABC transporter protein LptC